MEAKRLLPLSGIVFVALVLVAVIGLGGGTPESAATGAEVKAHYEDNVSQMIASVLWAGSPLFLVLFAVGVAASRGPEGAAHIWQWVLVGGSLLLGAVLLVLAATNFALGEGADNGVSGEALQALNVLNGNGWVAFNPAFGVLMLGAAGTFLTRPRAHARLGWTALVLGVALFFPYANFFALILGLLWMIATGVALVRRTDESPLAARSAASVS